MWRALRRAHIPAVKEPADGLGRSNGKQRVNSDPLASRQLHDVGCDRHRDSVWLSLACLPLPPHPLVVLQSRCGPRRVEVSVTGWHAHTPLFHLHAKRMVRLTQKAWLLAASTSCWRLWRQARSCSLVQHLLSIIQLFK